MKKITHLMDSDGVFHPAVKRGWWCPVCNVPVLKIDYSLARCKCGRNLFKQWLPAITQQVRRKK